MNLQKIAGLICCSFLLATPTHAAVTLQFGQTGVARATGFADSQGQATNGMNWGIIISSSNSTFSPGSYDVFDRGVSGFLTVNGVLTDDYYVTQSLTTSNQTDTGVDPGGDGGITGIANVPFGGATNISQNDLFAIIWFESTPSPESYYGLMTNGQFLIPQDGQVASFAASVFGGSTADPIKSAAYQFAAIPEPSKGILLLYACIGLAVRRRR